MIYGLLLLVAGAAMFSGTLAWIVYDVVKVRKHHVKKNPKKRGYVIPPKSEMYEGIRIIDTK